VPVFERSQAEIKVPDPYKHFTFRIRVAGQPAKGQVWRVIHPSGSVTQLGSWEYEPIVNSFTPPLSFGSFLSNGSNDIDQQGMNGHFVFSFQYSPNARSAGASATSLKFELFRIWRPSDAPLDEFTVKLNSIDSAAASMDEED